MEIQRGLFMKYSVVDLNSIIPAKYNPRKIDEKEFEFLKESLRKLGAIIPVIVNKENNVIIAGHQRTKAMKALGLHKVNVFYVENITASDEMVFNQMHNYQDTEDGCFGIAKEKLTVGFHEVNQNLFDIKNYNKKLLTEIGRILIKYGNVLTAVICRNEVIVGCNYIKTCQLLDSAVNIYVLDDNKYDDAKFYLLRKYGYFCYDSLKKDTFIQGLAQLYRRTISEKNKVSNHSWLYENFVFSDIKGIRGKHILDFGAGKMAYIKKLSGYADCAAIEFYPHDYKSIDMKLGNKLIDYLCSILSKGNSLFDVVICDSVLNSVDCKAAEDAVMGCLNAFCKLNGVLFISGRNLRKVSENECTIAYCRSARFLDKNYFSGIYRNGHWYYQHFHTEDTYRALMEENGFKIIKENSESSRWDLKCEKISELPKEKLIKSIDYEFNLPLPNGKSYNRQEDVKNVLKKIYSW